MNMKLVVAGLGLACMLGAPAMASGEVPCSPAALQIASGYGQEMVETNVASSYSYYCLESEVRTIEAFNTLIEAVKNTNTNNCISNSANIYVKTWMAQIFVCDNNGSEITLSVMVDRLDGEIIMIFLYSFEQDPSDVLIDRGVWS